MPFNPASVLAKDANLADQHLKTADGDGTSGNPYLPYHADIGVGSPDDSIATDTVSNWTLVALGKAVFGRLMAIFNSIGDPGDAVATSDTGAFSIIALLKRSLAKSASAPLDASFIGADTSDVVANISAVLLSIEAVNPNSEMLYLQLYDSSGLPTGTPKRVYPVYPNGGLLLIDSSQWGSIESNRGLRFVNGIVWAFSTTIDTFTEPPVGTYIFAARYLTGV